MDAINTEPEQRFCVNCGNVMPGKFCQQCGEKVVNPAHDFSIKEFFEQILDDFTHLDSKILKTFKFLFFKPGQLTADFIKGKRVPFMRPVQLFIVASVLFYFFMPDSSSFYASYQGLNMGFQKKGFSPENPFKYNIKAAINAKSGMDGDYTANGFSPEKAFEATTGRAIEKASHLSKSMLFLLLPFWAGFFYLLFYRSQKYYVPHVIFTMHVFSFFILLDLLFLVFYFDILKLHVIESSFHLLPFFILEQLYIIIAARKVYRQGWVHATWKGILANIVLLLLLIFYRIFITQWAVYSL